MGEEANYREISQQYAQGAIRAVILINGAAAVALLSQLTPLLKILPERSLGLALVAFVFGVALGVSAWMCGFYNARFVDLKLRGQVKDYSVANRWQHVGVACLLLGLLSFLFGCLSLALQFLCSQP